MFAKTSCSIIKLLRRSKTKVATVLVKMTEECINWNMYLVEIIEKSATNHVIKFDVET